MLDNFITKSVEDDIHIKKKSKSKDKNDPNK